MNLIDLRQRTLKRLAQDPVSPVYWTTAEVDAALNRGQRLFALITLCLESIVTYPLTPGTAFYHMLATYPDWLQPLRVSLGGLKVRPADIDELDARDDVWEASVAATTEYGCLGMDLFYVRGTTGTLEIAYARMPALMVGDNDPCEIIDASQPCLIDYAIARLRAKQGGQEFTKARPYFQRFLSATRAAAKDTMERSIRAGHDRQPFELKRIDPKALLALEASK